MPFSTKQFATIPTAQRGALHYSDETPDVSLNYDRKGQLVQIADGAGTKIIEPTITGQPGNETHAGSLTVGRTYDNYLRLATVSSIADSTLTTTYGYDSASRFKSATSNGLAATYHYHPNSKLVDDIVFTNGANPIMTTSKDYDFLNRLGNINTVVAAQTVSATTYGYNGFNQRSTATSADGTFWQFGYDTLGQLTSGSHKLGDGNPLLGQQFGYSFDDIGNRKTTTLNGRVSNYTPNILNQYVSRTVPNAVDIIGKAKVGTSVVVNNQTASRQGEYFSKDLNFGTTNNTAPGFEEVIVEGIFSSDNVEANDISVSKTGKYFVPKTPEVCSYDFDGNITGDGRYAYTWDAENRLKSMETIATVPNAAMQKLEFKYDGFGRRYEKVVFTWDGTASIWILAKTTRFIYDGWNLIRELNGTGATVRSYVWGLDLSGSMQGAGGVGGLLFTTHHGATTTSWASVYDGNGSLTQLINVLDGTIGAEYEYGPFGEPFRATGVVAESNPFRFSTKYCDEETGLLYYGYRYYQPVTGRWLSQDPIEENGGINLYAFVDNNSANYVDLLGLRTCWKYVYITHFGDLKMTSSGYGDQYGAYKKGRLVSGDIAVGHSGATEETRKDGKPHQPGGPAYEKRSQMNIYPKGGSPLVGTVSDWGSYHITGGGKKKKLGPSDWIDIWDPVKSKKGISTEGWIEFSVADNCPCPKGSIEGQPTGNIILIK